MDRTSSGEREIEQWGTTRLSKCCRMGRRLAWSQFHCSNLEPQLDPSIASWGAVQLLMRSDQVQSAFGDPTAYLSRRYRLRWRRDAVQEFVGNAPIGRVIDVGCGDGSLTRPVLDRCEHLTLVDTSEAMLQSARRQVPEQLRHKVDFLQTDVSALNVPA